MNKMSPELNRGHSTKNASVRLTKKMVDEIPAPGGGKRLFVYDGGFRGLLLVVGSKSRTWYADGYVGRKRRRVKLGRADAIPPEEARKRAAKALAAMGDGVDRNRERREQAQAQAEQSVTLGDVFEAYVAAHTGLKSGTVADYRRNMETYLAELAVRPVAEITGDEVEQWFLLASRRGATRANGAARVLRALFRFWAAGVPGPVVIPTQRLSDKRLWNKVRRKDGFLSTIELPLWWKSLEAARVAGEPLQAVDFLALALFTGIRRTDLLSLRWSDIDEINRCIVIPDPKNRIPFRLPVGEYAWGLLQRRKRTGGRSPWVFPGRRKTGHFVNFHQVLQRIKAETGIYATAHDLRRTFGSVIQRCEGGAASFYLTKRLMGHSIKADVTFGYIQFEVEQLRRTMQAVEDHILVAVGAKALPDGILLMERGKL